MKNFHNSVQEEKKKKLVFFFQKNMYNVKTFMKKTKIYPCG